MPTLVELRAWNLNPDLALYLGKRAAGSMRRVNQAFTMIRVQT
jgi:hypothetical protein